MNSIIITIGYIWDLIFSEPKIIMHPVVMIGKLIKFLEGLLYRKEDSDKLKFLKGLLLNLMVLSLVFFLLLFLVRFALKAHLYLYLFLSGILVSFTISTEALKDAAMAIYKELEEGNLQEARLKTSIIVGRDTDKLTESEISRAVIETVSENIVDGVTSPLFYGLLGGAPLAFLYRAVNTMDSMLGYKNEKYLYFGKFSALLDDVFNFIPARLTSLLIVIIAYLHPGLNGKNALKTVLKDARKHPSPNGGYTEGAAAGALEIRLGGYNYYEGKKEFREYMGLPLKELTRDKIPGSVTILYLASSAWVALAFIFGRW